MAVFKLVGDPSSMPSEFLELSMKDRAKWTAQAFKFDIVLRQHGVNMDGFFKLAEDGGFELNERLVNQLNQVISQHLIHQTRLNKQNSVHTVTGRERGDTSSPGSLASSATEDVAPVEHSDPSENEQPPSFANNTFNF